MAHHNGRRATQFWWDLPGAVKGGAFQAMKSGWCGNIPKKQTEKPHKQMKKQKTYIPENHHLMAWGPQAMNRSNAKPEGR